MEIEDLVLSIEQMNHLKELGVEVKDTAIVWDSNEQDWASANLSNTYFDEDLKDCVPTLTLQEIFSMLPKVLVSENISYEIYLERTDAGYRCWSGAEIDHVLCHVDLMEDDSTQINETTLLYKLLCWCAERGYLNKE